MCLFFEEITRLVYEEILYSNPKNKMFSLVKPHRGEIFVERKNKYRK